MAEDKVAEDRRIQEIDSAFGQIGLALYNHYKDFTQIHLPFIGNQPASAGQAADQETGNTINLPYIAGGTS